METLEKQMYLMSKLVAAVREADWKTVRAMPEITVYRAGQEPLDRERYRIPKQPRGHHPAGTLEQRTAHGETN